MSRFHTIPPPSFSDFFVREDERHSFDPADWVLPYPWISMFIYTHIKSNFWGYPNKYDDQPKVLQIGCAQGGDSVAIANVLKIPMINGKLDIIDWFKGNLTVEETEEWSYNENNINLWKKHLHSESKKFNVEDTITVFEGDSRKILPSLPNDHYDIIFIDGGHEYNIVKSDIVNGFKKLKVGGIIVLDDVSASIEDYKFYNLANASDEIIEKDTYTFNNGHHFHAGVVKAFYEFFGNDHVFLPTHHKAYHIKKLNNI